MSDLKTPAAHKRTAVLVVHGIGSQRALETVRGIINAVWFDQDDRSKDPKRIWTHPESSGVDIDLSVMTTNQVSGKTDRSVDFHELYWAHLMSETPSVAVLLWLFELARRGPNFTGMNGLWYGAAVFLSLMVLSLALLALQAIVWMTGQGDTPQSILVTLIIMLLVAAVAALVAALFKRFFRLAGRAAALALVLGALVYAAYALDAKALSNWTNILLPAGVALLATRILMGRPGLRAFLITVVLSLAFFAVFVLAIKFGWETVSGIPRDSSFFAIVERLWDRGQIPWSLRSEWSAVAAWAIVAAYLALNAAFLQPFLGDAARYFRSSPGNVAVRREIRRQAVETLDSLHNDGAYDRIIVVAHSLGSVVAYDMLRAYYSRIHNELPDPKLFGPEFAAVDQAAEPTELNPEMRANGRRIVAQMTGAAAASSPDPKKRAKVWLVSDFVTVGAALAHAYYLMCNGGTLQDLKDDFRRRTMEREFPICPPVRLDADGLLGFTHWQSKVVHFHHGGLFGMTRWTNLYFPLEQLFWGDAIGGELAPIFGANVHDVKVSTRTPEAADFFTHTAYWKVAEPLGGREAPHIVALRNAINLDDE